MKQVLLIIIMLCTVTAYTASYEECGKTDGITASGTRAIEGRTVACDFLSFGTQVIISGQTYTVEDRIGSGHPSKLDVYMEDRQEALRFGRRQLEVEILESDDNG
ncbi:MAG: 3D domain-containing protein [Chlamydiales bacterium]|nr:3D domain-containing protein [Chlamydiales bacterium]